MRDPGKHLQQAQYALTPFRQKRPIQATDSYQKLPFLGRSLDVAGLIHCYVLTERELTRIQDRR